MLFKGFLFLALVAILFSKAFNHFSNFGKGVLEEHFGEIILTSGPWPRRRCCSKIFFFFFFFFFFSCSGCHFV